MRLAVVSASGVRVFLSTGKPDPSGKADHPKMLKPLFALAPPGDVRCLRGSELSAGDTTLLARATEGADGRVDLICISDLALPKSDERDEVRAPPLP